MKVPIRRIDKDLELPVYKTAGAAAMDCPIRTDVDIPAGEVRLVPLNIALKPPPGHFVLVAARSSLHKRGLMMANGVGIGDEDYCGNDDEYCVPLYNFSNKPASLKREERVVQMLILPVDRVEWGEVDELASPNRGGFGSTGT